MNEVNEFSESRDPGTRRGEVATNTLLLVQLGRDQTHFENVSTSWLATNWANNFVFFSSAKLLAMTV